MNLTLLRSAEADAALEERWKQAVRLCPHSTFFHTPEWIRLLENTYGRALRNATRIFTMPNGGTAVLPMVEMEYEGKGLLHNLVSNAPGVYGGFLSQGPLPEDFRQGAFVSLLGWRTKRVYIFGNPYNPASPAIKNNPRIRFHEAFTQLIDLSACRDEADLLNSYSKSVRKRIRRAEKEGYSLERAATQEDVAEYDRVYRAKIGEWGERTTSIYPRKLFENILALPEQAALWLIKKNGRVVGGNINFYHKGVCVDWQHVCDRDLLKTGISHFFSHRLILDAKERGFSVYDFNPSGGHAGVVEFKESFGAVKKHFAGCSLSSNGFYKPFLTVSRWFFN